jgi:hypothetical protein
MVHMHFCKNGGYRKRVVYVIFAGFALLPFVGLLGEPISFGNLIYLIFFEIFG